MAGLLPHAIRDEATLRAAPSAALDLHLTPPLPHPPQGLRNALPFIAVSAERGTNVRHLWEMILARLEGVSDDMAPDDASIASSDTVITAD